MKKLKVRAAPGLELIHPMGLKEYVTGSGTNSMFGNRKHNTYILKGMFKAI